MRRVFRMQHLAAPTPSNVVTSPCGYPLLGPTSMPSLLGTGAPIAGRRARCASARLLRLELPKLDGLKVLRALRVGERTVPRDSRRLIATPFLGVTDRVRMLAHESPGIHELDCAGVGRLKYVFTADADAA